jgi:hypothetical protein
MLKTPTGGVFTDASTRGELDLDARQVKAALAVTKLDVRSCGSAVKVWPVRTPRGARGPARGHWQAACPLRSAEATNLTLPPPRHIAYP